MIIYLFFEISVVMSALNAASYSYHFTVSNHLNAVPCSCMNHNISTRINCHHFIINHEFKGIYL